jgi:pyruvate formate lyase activating enzyme
MQVEAMFYNPLEDGAVHCHLCAHHCRIAPGETGFCRVRINRNGALYSIAYGETVARHVDPIEKKPLFHFLPGTRAYSIATAGCNFRCSFCQNWQISQTVVESGRLGDGRPFPPEAVVAAAEAAGCASIAYTYTEPTVFYEYARAIALAAKEKDIRSVFVTNGYMTRRALDEAAGWLDAANVDLKAWSNAFYQDICQAKRKPVCDTIAYLKGLDIWLEVTTLVVPGSNDSNAELEGIAGFLASVDPRIPWHISRFHPDYRFEGPGPTPMETLTRAANIGKAAGLRHVYLGNVADASDTLCPACGRPVVLRPPSGAVEMRLEDGRCPACGAAVDGRWALA